MFVFVKVVLNIVRPDECLRPHKYAQYQILMLYLSYLYAFGIIAFVLFQIRDICVTAFIFYFLLLRF